MSEMTVTPNPPVNTGYGPGVARPQPCDPPGAVDGAGWVKIDASTDGGWDRVDDVADANSAGWEQT